MIALYHPDLAAGLFDEPGIIGRGAAPGVGSLKHLAQEPLGGLDATQRPAIRGRQNAVIGIDHFDRVGHLEPGNNSGMACSHRAHHPFEQVGRRQSAGDVVNQDDAVFGAQCRQPRLDGCRPIIPSGHYIHTGVVTSDHTSLLDVGVWGDEHDMSHVGTTKNAPQSVSQDGLSAQRGERLGHPGTEPHTATGGDQDHGDIHCATTLQRATFMKPLVKQ